MTNPAEDSAVQFFSQRLRRGAPAEEVARYADALVKAVDRFLLRASTDDCIEAYGPEAGRAAAARMVDFDSMTKVAGEARARIARYRLAKAAATHGQAYAH